MSELRFAVDRMLGRLATWLRLLGYDATYGPHLTGPTLLRHARAEQRIVLTRNTRLAQQRATPPLHFVKADTFREQLRDIVTTFGLDPRARLLTRCCRCNHVLEPVLPAAVADRVPPYVRDTQDRFVRCSACRRVYWPATHDQRIRAELRALGWDPNGPMPGGPASPSGNETP